MNTESCLAGNALDKAILRVMVVCLEQTCPTQAIGMHMLGSVKRYRPLARKGRAAYREMLGSQSVFSCAASFLQRLRSLQPIRGFVSSWERSVLF
jgi:hypothetical protein